MAEWRRRDSGGTAEGQRREEIKGLLKEGQPGVAWRWGCGVGSRRVYIKLAQTLMSGLGLGVGDLRLTQDLIGQCQPSGFICRRHQDGS